MVRGPAARARGLLTRFRTLLTPRRISLFLVVATCLSVGRGHVTQPNPRST
jgi:hypothetical protein